MDLKTQMDPNTMEAGNFNTPLSPIDRSPDKKSTKKF
jgi:hypothetical protein